MIKRLPVFSEPILSCLSDCSWRECELNEVVSCRWSAAYKREPFGVAAEHR